MANNKYAAFYAAFNNAKAKGNPLNKDEQVMCFTNGKTSSLQDLNEWELKELVRSLNNTHEQKFKPVTADDVKCDKMRKAIISIFYSMNRTAAAAIAWAEKQGAFGNKKKFNDYRSQELFVLINIAEKVKKDWQDSIANKLKNVL